MPQTLQSRETTQDTLITEHTVNSKTDLTANAARGMQNCRLEADNPYR